MPSRQYIAAERLVVALFGLGVGLLVADHNMPDAVRLAQSHEALQSIQRLNAEIAKCLPVDLGEKSILTLADEDGVLKLHCEKHEVVGFAEQPKALSASIIVPVSVD